MRPQIRIQRHTLEHADDLCPFVRILDALQMRMENQLLEVFRLLDTQRPVEQVIDVPKISQDSIQQRFVDRDFRHPQVAEQLVEVPPVVVARFRLLTFQHFVVLLELEVLKVFSQDRVILCLPSRSLSC